jgi:hypothetical protein
LGIEASVSELLGNEFADVFIVHMEQWRVQGLYVAIKFNNLVNKLIGTIPSTVNAKESKLIVWPPSPTPNPTTEEKVLPGNPKAGDSVIHVMQSTPHCSSQGRSDALISIEKKDPWITHKLKSRIPLTGKVRERSHHNLGPNSLSKLYRSISASTIDNQHMACQPADTRKATGQMSRFILGQDNDSER